MSGGTDSTTPTTAAETTPVFGRRRVLRGGAVLAGAAAGAAVAGLTPEAAHAADGDNLVLGQDNTANSTTTLTVGGAEGGPQAALSLENAGGPSLQLNNLPPSWPGQLTVGEMAGTDLGPIVGVDTFTGPTTTYLVTGVDLTQVPMTFPVGPSRILDLRTASGRAAIIRRSVSNALTSTGKLRAGQWIDIGLTFTSPDFVLDGVFANLTAMGGLANGHAVLYPPGTRPGIVTLSYQKAQTNNNAAFAETGTALNQHAIRLHSTAEAWFLIDLSAAVVRGNTLPPLGAAAAAAARPAARRTALLKKLNTVVGRATR